MSTLFGNLSNNGLEESQDRLGGGFGAIDSDIYKLKIKALYAGQSATPGSQAQSITLIAENGNREYRETFWVTNSKGENWYPAKANGVPTGKKAPLPGFTIVDDICQIATGKPLSEQATEEKMVKIYDNDQKKEIPKAVPMLVEAIGQEIALGVVRQLVNKNAKNETTGQYEPTAEEREENVTDKVFHPELKLTIVEAKAGNEVGTFWDGWLELNKGKTKDRRKIKDGAAGAAGAPPKAGRPAGAAPVAGASAAAPRKSLFAK